MELTSWDSAQAKLKNPKTIVIYYGDWCPHCTSKADMWKDFAKHLKGKVDVYKLESKYHKAGAINGVPTYGVNTTGSSQLKNSGAEDVSGLEKDLLGTTGGRHSRRLVNRGRKTNRTLRGNVAFTEKLRSARRRRR